MSLLPSRALAISALAISARAYARPLAVTIESLKVNPTTKDGAAWDEGGGLPDLQVRVTSEGEELLTSPIFTDSLELGAPLHLIMEREEASLEIFVIDADDTKDTRITALRVRPRPELIGAGAKLYRASNVEQLRVSFEAVQPEETGEAPEEASAEEVPVFEDEGQHGGEEPTGDTGEALYDLSDATVIDLWEGVSAYTPRPSTLPALSSLDLSASRLDPALLSDEEARALYREASRLRAEGFGIEAKEALARLIALYPKSFYALKARRDLF